MENKSNSKKGNVFQILLCIAVVGLIVTVIIQGYHIKSLDKTNNDVLSVENGSVELKTEVDATEEKQPVTLKKQEKDKALIPELKTVAVEKQTNENIDDIPRSRQAGQLLEKLAAEEAEKTGISVDKLMKFYKDTRRTDTLLEEKLIEFLKSNNKAVEVYPEKKLKEKEKSDEK